MKQAGIFVHITTRFSQTTFRLIYGDHVEQADRGLKRTDWESLELRLGLATNPPSIRFARWTKPFSFWCLLESNAVVMKLGKRVSQGRRTS